LTDMFAVHREYAGLSKFSRVSTDIRSA
jgi:hypothetical protein